MGVMRWTLLNRLKAKYGDDMIGVTYGYITKHTRIENNLEKAHYIDAGCISGNATAKPNGEVWRFTKHRSHNRQIHKCTILKGGGRKLNQGPRVMYGFRLFDVVMYNGRLGYITSKRTRGAFKITWFDDNTSTDGISYKRLKLVRHSRNIDIG